MTGRFIIELHERYGLTRIVNACGRLTAYSNSRVEADVIDAASAALRHWFHADELQSAASREIADFTGAEAGFVTACCAAGVTLSVAACMTGTDLGKVAQLPDAHGMKTDVIVQKGHVVDFGAPVAQMVRLAGATMREVGSVNRTDSRVLASAIGSETAAVLFVVSHHTARFGCVPLAEVVSMAHAQGVPVIVDAAAEEYLLREIVATGADLVTCSGHKYLAGPVAGLVCGRKDLIDAVALQNQGIGRPMKVGKEGIVGLLAAIEAMKRRDPDADLRRIRGLTDALGQRLGDIPGVRTESIGDPTGNPWTRLRIHIDFAAADMDAATVCRVAAAQDPAVLLRAHHVDDGYFDVELNDLRPDEIEIVANTLASILTAESSSKASWRRGGVSPADPRLSWLGQRVT